MPRRTRSAGGKQQRPAQPVERKRGKSTGAIGRLVAQVQKTSLLKAKSDGAAVQKIEESIKLRFIEGAEYFDKDNLVAELITEQRGNFKNIDMQLTAQHTIATRKLHQLVYQHSNGFLNLFREVHKAHDYVDDLKKEVHSMKTIISALSKVTFSSQSGASSNVAAQPHRAVREGGVSSRGGLYRPSMIVDSGHVDRLLAASSTPTESLQCASYQLASSVLRGPRSSLANNDANDTCSQIQLFRDVAIEEVRQRIGELELTAAADWIHALEREASEKGLEPVVLQLEQELAHAAAKQLTRLPVTVAFFDALHLPLLELLVQLNRPQQATELFLSLQSQCIVGELHKLQDTTVSPHDYCLIATDLVVSMVKMALRGLGRLGVPVDKSRPQAPFVNAQVTLWVRQEIEVFGSSFLAQRILTMYRSNAANGAQQIAVVASTLSDCVACVKAVEEIGFPHADLQLMGSMRAPLAQLLDELGRRTYKRQYSVSQTMWNAVRHAVRHEAKQLLQHNNIPCDEATKLTARSQTAAEIAALNKQQMAIFDGLAPTSHSSLLQLLCYPAGSPLFQSSLSVKVSNDTMHSSIKRGLQQDPFVWSESIVVRKLLAEAAASKNLPAAAQLLSSSRIAPVPRSMRVALVEALAAHRFSSSSIRSAFEQEAVARLQFLTHNAGGGHTSDAISPAHLSQLLTRPDIATPYWSRSVRDIFSDALTATCSQLQPAINDVMQMLDAHAGTNPVAQTQRKVILSVLRNYRFVAADIPEEFVERIDGQHLKWMFSQQCPLMYWSCTGPREFLADVIEATPQLNHTADWVPLLRSDEVVTDELRAKIHNELFLMVTTMCAAEEPLGAGSGPLLSLEYIRSFLTQGGISAGQWPRVVRLVLALALEKKFGGHSGFAKIAEISKKLRDAVPIRVGHEDRRLVSALLTTKGDEVHIQSALAAVSELSPEEMDEQSALACISTHHLTHLVNRSSSDIGIPYWSRATRDALADALERGQQQKLSSSVTHALISLLRVSPLLTTRISVEQRRMIRDLLKRKVEHDASVSTREIAKQQWIRFSPAMIQRLVVSGGGSNSGGSGGSADASGGANYWCDVVRRCVRDVVERIMEHRQSLVDTLRGPTRNTVLKMDRLELSKLLEGYPFSASDIAKRCSSSAAVPAGGGTSAAAKQLMAKAVVPHDDFPVILSNTIGPSQLFHTTAAVLFCLHGSAQGNGDSRMAARSSVLLQDAWIAEVLDKTCAGVSRSMIDVLRLELRNLQAFLRHKTIQEASSRMDASAAGSPSRDSIGGALSWKRLCKHGTLHAPFVWVYHTAFAMYLDALALGASVSFSQSLCGVAQRVGEGLAIRTALLSQFEQELLSPFLIELAELVFHAAKEGPLCFESISHNATGLNSIASQFISARYVGSSVPLGDVTAPSRMAGCLLPLEGYCAWRVVATVPRYPHFSTSSVSLEDEAFLFHCVVQVSLNMMATFQEVLLGDFDDAITSVAQTPLRSPQQFMRQLTPTDSSTTQHWVVQRSCGSNHVAALSLLQYLVVTTLRQMCDVKNGGVLAEIYGAETFAGASAPKPQILRQVLIFFAAYYYFWVPLFSSERTTSLFANGFLSQEAPPPPPPSSGNPKKPTPVTEKLPSLDSHLTSEVSQMNVDNHTPAKRTLANVLLSASHRGGSDQASDHLQSIIGDFFNSVPALDRFGSAIHSDAMKAKLSTLFTKVNLLQFAASNTLVDDEDDDEEEEEEDDEEPSTPSPGNDQPRASVTMAHLHELLIHYVRLVS